MELSKAKSALQKAGREALAAVRREIASARERDEPNAPELALLALGRTFTPSVEDLDGETALGKALGLRPLVVWRRGMAAAVARILDNAFERTDWRRDPVGEAKRLLEVVAAAVFEEAEQEAAKEKAGDGKAA